MDFLFFFFEIHIFGVYILNNFQTTQNTRFGRMWFGPQLISGFGIGRRKMEEKMSGMKKTLGKKGGSKDLVTERMSRYANKIKTN